MRFKLFAAAFASLCVGTTALAQSTPAPAPVRRTLTINPHGLPFGIISGEFERALSGPVSLGAEVGYMNADDLSGFAGGVKARYYPNERAPRGFSLGGSLGLAGYNDDSCVEFCTGSSSATGVTAGVLLDYNWLLGARRRFVVGTGISASRVFVDDEFDGDVSAAYAGLRLQVGYAF